MVAYIVGCDSNRHLLWQLLHDQAAWNLASSIQMMSVRPSMNNQPIPLKENTEKVAKYNFTFNLYLFSQK
jgi:hypothetical protein